MRGMKKLIVAIVLATCIGILALPATAGGRKGNTTGGTSTIKLESYSDLKLGGYVGFDTNSVGLAGWEYPMVAVWCYQNGDLVFGALDKPGAEVLLGGGGSIWLTNGGAANCRADLDAYGWKGGQESIRKLADTTFDAAGAAG
jgi:hypothetical protein